MDVLTLRYFGDELIKTAALSKEEKKRRIRLGLTAAAVTGGTGAAYLGAKALRRKFPKGIKIQLGRKASTKVHVKGKFKDGGRFEYKVRR